jgi:hypothetical protein
MLRAKGGVRVRSANSTCENQGAWVAKSLTKSEALVGDAHSGNADVKNGLSTHKAPCALLPGKGPDRARAPPSAS